MKRYFLIAGIALVVVGLAAFIGMISIPTRVKQAAAAVNYSQTGAFAYTIYLKPSYLYGPPPRTSPPNPQYPLAAVGTIDFTYSFSPLTQDSATSSVEAVLGNGEIWQKKITLVPETAARGDFKLSFSLDPGEMNSLFDAIEKDTGIAASPRSLTVNVHTRSGDDSFTQSLPLTLDKNLIEISSNLSQTLPEGAGKFNYVVNRRAVPVEAAPPPAKYPAEIVNSLDFTFTYKPVKPGSTIATVEAIMENPDAWKKDIMLITGAPVSADLPLRFSLNLNDLVSQFNDIDKQTKLTTQVRTVTLQVSVSQGNDSFVQILPMTINNGVLEISGELQLARPNGSGTLDYTVNLKPNTLFKTGTLPAPHPTPAATGQTVPSYDINPTPGQPPAASPDSVLAPDQTAFTRLIDRMNVTFSYRFQADQPVEGLKTDIDISAILEAPKLWSRTFPLLHAAKSGNFDLTFPVDVTGYTALLQAIAGETGVSSDSYNIAISAVLHTTGDTQYGQIDNIFNPYMKGTISGDILQWNKDLAANQPGAIQTVTSGPNRGKYLGLSAGGARSLAAACGGIFLVLGILALVLFVRTKPAIISQLGKEAALIKKKYGGRLVETVNFTPAPNEKVIALNSMEDLIKLADELSKPVLYQAPNSFQAEYAYFVIDGAIRYRYSLKAGTN